jgi:hypothetical protein
MLNHPAMFISLNVLGSVVLDASGLELEVKFLDAAGVVRDYCTIRKGAGGSPPVPPSGLTATPVSTSRIDLAWVDGSVDETALVIERSLDGVAWAGHALLAANVVAYTDAGLQPATMYHYRVKARNGAGDSLPSNAASATTFAAGTSDQVAVSEAAVSGTVSGTFLNTWTPDGVRESIREIESGGRKSRRFSFLEHRWPFDLSPGSSATLFLKGHRTASTDGDNFVFAYSADGSSFTDLLTLTKTSDDGLYESAALPAGLSGTVIIRVRDSNRLPGTRARDTVHIDHLFIRSE